MFSNMESNEYDEYKESLENVLEHLKELHIQMSDTRDMLQEATNNLRQITNNI